ncbi:hypothetical protein GPECTOR_2g1581 [Gonium pectorale]|uniref:HRDC domain-containing protein n=1 Tax=Gonium pectorale TaxID=33097 RepID=A0A150H1M8_GONPE|nr:hypothetical protein GPECTOR_2g1581 [Gonium pectorale]|eukprot:KXZ56029.1 hypothetical protein GPECTOR_2g1581 [Gonium pectorale]
MLATCEGMVRSRRQAAPDFTDAEEVAEWTSSLLDDTLERLDAALDAERAAARGRERAREAGAGGQDAAAAGGALDDVALMANLPSFGGTAVRATRHRGPVRHAAALARPQDGFAPPPDNQPDVPFRPRVDHLAGLTAAPLDPRDYEAVPGAPEAYPHPFRAELDALSYTPQQLSPPDPPRPPPPPPDASPPPVWVDTPEALAALAADLAEVQDVALDLEAHSFRAFTCLMQISTRTTDYVVDALVLRSQLGPALARVFADPQVVKVLHGADGDVEWLQRDFGLFLVNMFDTGQAARVLSLQSAGLAHLLEREVGFQPDKRYQLADWRLRPLPPDMLHYARCDTHFLLHVYDRLRQQLRDLPDDRIPPSLLVPLPPPPANPGGALGLVLERSRQLCLKTYRKPVLSPAEVQNMLLRWGLTLSPAQTSVFSALLSWRDRVCRAEDESGGYVLPKAQLVALAQDMPDGAKRVQAVLGRAVSEVVVRRMAELVVAINEARHRPAELQAPAGAQAAAAAAPQAGSGQAAGGAASGSGIAARPLQALKPRAVAPIRAARPAATGTAAAVAAAPAALPHAAPAAAATAGAASGSGAEGSGPGPTGAAQPEAEPEVARQEAEPAEAEDKREKEEAAAAAAERAATGAKAGPSSQPAGSASRAAAGGGLRPRALKAPALSVSRTAALFGGAAAPATAAAGAASATEASAPAAASQSAEAEPSAGPRGDAGPAPVADHSPPGKAAVPPIGLRKATAGASLLGSMFGAGSAAALSAGASAAGTTAAGRARPDEDEDGDEEALAAQRVKRLRATFALPFVAAASSPAPAAPTAAASGRPAAAAAVLAATLAARNDAEEGDGAGDGAGGEGRRATAAEVRAAVEALQAEGDVDVIMGDDGQGVEVPAGTADAGGGGGAGGDGGRAAPAARRVSLDEDGVDGDGDGEDGEEEDGGGGGKGQAEQAEAGGGAAAGGVRVAGSELGLDLLEYVPLPLSQMYPKEKKDRKRGAGADGGGQLRGARGGARHATVMRRFITEVPADAAGGAGGGGYCHIMRGREEGVNMEAGRLGQRSKSSPCGVSGGDGAGEEAVVKPPEPTRVADTLDLETYNDMAAKWERALSLRRNAGVKGLITQVVVMAPAHPPGAAAAAAASVETCHSDCGGTGDGLEAGPVAGSDKGRDGGPLHSPVSDSFCSLHKAPVIASGGGCGDAYGVGCAVALPAGAGSSRMLWSEGSGSGYQRYNSLACSSCSSSDEACGSVTSPSAATAASCDPGQDGMGLGGRCSRDACDAATDGAAARAGREPPAPDRRGTPLPPKPTPPSGQQRVSAGAAKALSSSADGVGGHRPSAVDQLGSAMMHAKDPVAAGVGAAPVRPMNSLPPLLILPSNDVTPNSLDVGALSV